MTRRPLPLLVDALPLYATDAELMGAVFGARAGSKLSIWLAHAKRPDFPPLHPAMGGRFVPAVTAFFETYEVDYDASARRLATEEASWHKPTRKRRVAAKDDGPTAA